VTSQGDKPVIAKGVCFDTLASPTILKNKTFDGWGTGTFTSAITNLKSSKKYYVRAYAVSEFGIAYGSEVTFTTNDKVFVFNDEFTDNTNNWPVGSITNGTSSVSAGDYIVSFSQTGYLWRRYITINGFTAIANSKDFEISTRLMNLPYSVIAINASYIVGFVWDCSSTNFKYFGIKRQIGSSLLAPDVFYYTVGSYNGSYTVWKDYTVCAGTYNSTLTIKKANGYYYFFVDDIQVFKYSYSNLTYDALGFYVDNATLKVNYIHLKQQGDKKSAETDLIQMTSGLGGSQDITRSASKK
jgi:hypothetical protein